jgi:hypothetical protein
MIEAVFSMLVLNKEYNINHKMTKLPKKYPSEEFNIKLAIR